MSKQIITDYMAGKIGDEYWVSDQNGVIRALGVVDHIDEEATFLRYRIDLSSNVRSNRRPWYSGFDHFEREVPDEESESDEGMERITDIKQVCSGDIEVTKSGNRYEVIETDNTLDTLKLRVAIPESNDEYTWLHDSAFAYALRPKPKVPTEPGLYFDSVKDVWALYDDGTRQLIRRDGRYVSFGLRRNGLRRNGLRRNGLSPKFAPYSRIDLDDDHE
jgi:hypothetical protein